MAKTETALDEHINVTWSPEAPIQPRIASFNILKRLEVLDQISDADFELAA